MKFFPVKVTVDVSEERVRDILTSAWEGGSAYWCSYKNVVVPDKSKSLVEARKSQGDFYSFDYAFIPGVEIILVDNSGEGDEIGHPQPWILTREKLAEGLNAMANKYPKHFSDFISENDDATTADVFLQMCLFGDIIFG